MAWRQFHKMVSTLMEGGMCGMKSSESISASEHDTQCAHDGIAYRTVILPTSCRETQTHMS